MAMDLSVIVGLESFEKLGLQVASIGRTPPTTGPEWLDCRNPAQAILVMEDEEEDEDFDDDDDDFEWEDEEEEFEGEEEFGEDDLEELDEEDDFEDDDDDEV